MKRDVGKAAVKHANSRGCLWPKRCSLGLLMTPKTKVLTAAVSGAVAVSVFFLIPQLIKSRCTSARVACIANLKRIDEAKAKWAEERANRAGGTNSPSADDGVLRDRGSSTNSLSKTNNDRR